MCCHYVNSLDNIRLFSYFLDKFPGWCRIIFSPFILFLLGVMVLGFFSLLFVLWNKWFSIRIRRSLKVCEDSLVKSYGPGTSELTFPVSDVVFSILTRHRKVLVGQKNERQCKTRSEPSSSHEAGSPRNFILSSEPCSGWFCSIWKSRFWRIPLCWKTWSPNLNCSGNSVQQVRYCRKPKWS